jgi:mannose-1-phosphate guanylyltransferase
MSEQAKRVDTSHAWAVVMAGGAGTRFWPASRRAKPKQLLPLAGPESLIATTVARIAPVIPPERVLVVTAAHLVEPTRAELPSVPAENVLAEPAARNTAPCVGWAAEVARARDPEAVLVVLAADHHVTNAAEYERVTRVAIGAATSGSLVTLGMKPTRPETGYGYLEVGPALGDGSHRALRFVEKPSRAVAEEYVASGRFLWNSGNFFFRADAVLGEIAKQLPALASGLAKMREQRFSAESIREVFPTLPSISIDHGVMEKAADVRVVPADFGWSDVGSWVTAWELAEKDAAGNAVVDADAVVADARGNYVRAPEGKIVAIIGVTDLVVVDTGDALLVMPRERAQDVKLAVEALGKRSPPKGV